MKNRFKKFLSLLLILLVSISLVSCFGDNLNNGGGIAVNPEPPILEKVSYRINFYVDGNLKYHIDAAPSQILDASDVPFKKNHDFLGWFNSKDVKHDFNKPFTEKTNLYAKYAPNYKDITNELSEYIISSNVKIEVETYNKNFLGFKTNRSTHSGSGIIFLLSSNNYYILSNEHVVNKKGKDYADYKVIDYKGNDYEATTSSKYIKADYDLSVLSFKKGKENLNVIKLASKNSITSTEVIALGQPGGQSNTITFGKILQYKTVTLTTGFTAPFPSIEHDVKISGGSSGGALLNLEFKLIGLNYASATYVESGDYYASYAIPIEKVIDALKQMGFTFS